MSEKKLSLAEKMALKRKAKEAKQDDAGATLEQSKASKNNAEANVIGRIEERGVRTVASNKKYRSLEPEECRPWCKHDRSSYWLTPSKLQKLANSIREKGQNQLGAVRVVENDDGSPVYEIIYGVRRWQACKLAGVKFKATILPSDTPDAELIELMDDENDESEGLSELERVASYARAVDNGDYTMERLMERKKISRRTYFNWMKAGSLYKYSVVWEKLESAIIGVSLREAVKLADEIDGRLDDDQVIRVQALHSQEEIERGDHSDSEYRKICSDTASQMVGNIISALRNERVDVDCPPLNKAAKIKHNHAEQHKKAILQSTYNPDNGSTRITIEKELVMKTGGDKEKLMAALEEVVDHLSETWKGHGLTSD